MNREKLMAAGIDYASGLNRFGGSDRLYEKYLIKFFEDDIFDTLCAQMAQNDYANAARSAHALKGTAGNLSVESLFQTVSQLVELLRNESERHEADIASTFSQCQGL